MIEIHQHVLSVPTPFCAWPNDVFHHTLTGHGLKYFAMHFCRSLHARSLKVVVEVRYSKKEKVEKNSQNEFHSQ